MTFEYEFEKQKNNIYILISCIMNNIYNAQGVDMGEHLTLTEPSKGWRDGSVIKSTGCNRAW